MGEKREARAHQKLSIFEQYDPWAQLKPKLFAPYLFKTWTSAKTIQTLQLTTTTVETRKKR
jgi:hypothetical protein